MMHIIQRIIYTVVFVSVMSISVNGQPSPPGSHGEDSDQDSRNAPIGSGMVILLAMGAGYTAKKVYDSNKER